MRGRLQPCQSSIVSPHLTQPLVPRGCQASDVVALSLIFYTTDVLSRTSWTESSYRFPLVTIVNEDDEMTEMLLNCILSFALSSLPTTTAAG